MKIIGVTGNSGSGKSTICEIMLQNGCFIIDCDRIAHDVLKLNGSAYQETVLFFGKEILYNDSKEIDRNKLGKIVFSDAEKLRMLTEITHKYILKQIDYYIEKNKNYKIIVLDAPLLIEANLHKKSDEVWLVYANRQVSIERIMKRDKISRELAIKRLDAQMNFEEQKKYATFTIENTGDIVSLKKIIKRRIQCI